MILTRREKIALEEYFGAAEELYRHLSDDNSRRNPPVIAFLVRQLGSARPAMLAALREHQGSMPLPEVG